MRLKWFLSNLNMVLAVFIYFIFFIIYLTTIAPTISTGDSGEFITASAILGIPHAPGYPLYTLLGHLFSLIPLHSVAWRLNFMSAIFHSFALVVTFFSFQRIFKFLVEKKTWEESRHLLSFLAFSSTLTLGLTYVFWLYSIVADVFSLNSLIASLIILLTLIWREKALNNKGGIFSKQDYALLCGVFLLFGLGMANHLSIVLLGPTLLLILIRSKSIILNHPKKLIFIFISFLPGLFLYLYLPLSASHNPLLNWGNPDSPASFIRVLLRSDYGTFSLSSLQHNLNPNITDFGITIFNYFKEVVAGGNFVILIFFIYGIYSILRKDRSLGFFLLLGFLFSTLTFLFSGNLEQHEAIWGELIKKFYILPNLFLYLIAGGGMASLVELILKSRRGFDPLLKTLSIPLLVLFFSVLPMLIYFKQLPKADQSNNTLVYDFGFNILQSIESGSIFLSYGENNAFSMIYLLWVEKRRPDIKFIDQALLSYEWYVKDIKIRYPDIIIPFESANYSKNYHPLTDFIMANINNNPIYFESITDMRTIQDFKIEPHGLARKFILPQKEIDYEKLLAQNELLFSSYLKNNLSIDNYPPKSYEGILVQHWVMAYETLGNIYYQRGSYEKAEENYQKALEIWPQQEEVSDALENVWKTKKGL